MKNSLLISPTTFGIFNFENRPPPVGAKTKMDFHVSLGFLGLEQAYFLPVFDKSQVFCANLGFWKLLLYFFALLRKKHTPASSTRHSFRETTCKAQETSNSLVLHYHIPWACYTADPPRSHRYCTAHPLLYFLGGLASWQVILMTALSVMTTI